MKKILFVLSSLVLSIVLAFILLLTLSGYTISWGSSNDRVVDYIYLIPEDFKGCAWIRYGYPGGTPLEINNDEVIFRIPENGILLTSTDYGQVPPLHITKVFSVNDKGERVKQLIDEYDQPPSSVYSFNNQNPGDVRHINFDSSEEQCEFLEHVNKPLQIHVGIHSTLKVIGGYKNPQTLL